MQDAGPQAKGAAARAERQRPLAPRDENPLRGLGVLTKLRARARPTRPVCHPQRSPQRRGHDLARSYSMPLPAWPSGVAAQVETEDDSETGIGQCVDRSRGIRSRIDLAVLDGTALRCEHRRATSKCRAGSWSERCYAGVVGFRAKHQPRGGGRADRPGVRGRPMAPCAWRLALGAWGSWQPGWSGSPPNLSRLSMLVPIP